MGPDVRLLTVGDSHLYAWQELRVERIIIEGDSTIVIDWIQNEMMHMDATYMPSEDAWTGFQAALDMAAVEGHGGHNMETSGLTRLAI